MIALFFDTETTGVRTWQNPDFIPGLVQLGAILQDTESRRVLAEVNLIATQPEGTLIPAEASAVHGITDELAARFGVNAVGIDRLFAALVAKADVIVAHNIQYDLDVVHDNMPESERAITDRRTFCTMQGSLYIVQAPLSAKQKAYFTSKGKMPDAPFKVPNLTETHQHFYGKPFEGAHDAMADIRACRDTFFTLLDEGYWQVINGEVVPTDKLDELQQAALAEVAS